MLHMHIWRTSAHTSETNANPRQNHRTREIRAPETPACSQRHQRQRDSRTRAARHPNAILLGAHLPTSGHQSLNRQAVGRRSPTRTRRRHARDRRRSPNRRAEGQSRRQGRRKPASRQTGLHGQRCGPKSRPAADSRRSPRRLRHHAHEPPTTLRSHAPQIYPLRPQSHQADEGGVSPSPRSPLQWCASCSKPCRVQKASEISSFAD